jgi:predicted dehydrogenase
VVGVIGAGNFTDRVLLPAMRKADVRLKAIASVGGVSGTHLGRKFGFEESTTDAKRILSDPEINTIFVTTRHNTHAHFVIEALKAQKHVFVEKPLCIDQQQLSDISETYSAVRNLQSEAPLLMVGFNRRFSPHILKIKELLKATKEPKSMIMTVNAGALPQEHWVQDPEIGGGRLVGEACHFVDLLRFLAGCEISGSEISRLQSGGGDTLSIQFSFSDGSIGTIHYFANGHRSFPKEHLVVFCSGRILQLDNFKRLRGYGWPGLRKMNLWKQDKGHTKEIELFINAIKKQQPSPIPYDEIVEVTKLTLNLSHNIWGEREKI